MITFLSVPTGVKVPGNYTEFDTSKASQGASIQEHKVLIFGNRLAAGTKAAGEVVRVSSDSQAREYFGAGSMLFYMVKAYIADNKGINAVDVVALDDDGAAVAASGSLKFDTVATKDGTFSFYIGGKVYRIAATTADTVDDLATKLAAEITADTDAIVTSAVNGVATDTVDFTFKHACEAGNDLDLQANYNGEDLPQGLTITITAMSGGTANPSVAPVISAIGENQYHEIASPYTDTANLTLWDTELSDRWDPVRQNDGQLYCIRKDSYAAFTTFLSGLNSAHITTMSVLGPATPWESAAGLAGVIARSAQSDPALPFETLVVNSIPRPSDAQLYQFTERDQILKEGGSTFIVNANGRVAIERMRTTRVQDDFAAPSEALADLNTKLSLSYLRYDFNTYWRSKYARYKLANDGTKFASGQRIITPKAAKADVIARFRLWEFNGLVEGVDQFKNDLIVVRSSNDAARLDIGMSPDVINQLRVVGTQIAYLL